MKLIYRRKVQVKGSILGATYGHRCDEIRLSAKDVRDMYGLLASGSFTQQLALKETLSVLLTRFAPESNV